MRAALSGFAALCLGATALSLGAAPMKVCAQGLDPRTAQAMAVCNSPAGALIAECKQLKALATLGAVPGVQGAAGPEAAMARQQVYQMCMAQANGNAAAISACTQALGGPMPGANTQTNTAMAIAQGGQRYQACVSALMAQGGQVGGINPCTPLINGQPAGAGAPAGFGAPLAIQAPPTPNNPPAPGYPGAPIAAPVAAPAAPFDPLGL
jgi:hypothetical protein